MSVILDLLHILRSHALQVLRSSRDKVNEYRHILSVCGLYRLTDRVYANLRNRHLRKKRYSVLSRVFLTYHRYIGRHLCIYALIGCLDYDFVKLLRPDRIRSLCLCPGCCGNNAANHCEHNSFTHLKI